MKIVKYVLSFMAVILATLTALYFPGWYFDTYEYSASIEDMENQDYAKLGSTSSSAYMVYRMLEDDNYSVKELYGEEYGRDLNEDSHLYLGMVTDVFAKYIKYKGADLEQGEYDADLLTGYMISWIGESGNWLVNKVSVLNLNAIYEGKMVYVQLYYLELEIPDSAVTMRICLDSEKNIFYGLAINDYRFALEDISEAELIWDLVIYYQESESKNAYSRQDEKLFDLMTVVTAPGYVIIGNTFSFI